MSRPNRKYKNSEIWVQVLAESNYLERIGKNPFNPKQPLVKYKHVGTLFKREKTHTCLGVRISKPPF